MNQIDNIPLLRATQVSAAPSAPAPARPAIPGPATPAPASPSPAGPAPGSAPKRSVGVGVPRIEGPLKVTGTAPYAYEHDVENPLYLFPITATIARGRVLKIDTTAAERVEGVELVLTQRNAPRLRVKALPDLWVLQNDQVHYHGQFIGAVVATSSAVARYAASLVEVTYAQQTARLRFNHNDPRVKSPRMVGVLAPGRSEHGDVEAALATSVHVVDEMYGTAAEFHSAIEPHAVIATWHNLPRTDLSGKRLSLFDANQGPLVHVPVLSALFGLLPQQIEIISPHVGGSFGSKGWPHPHLVLTAMAAKVLAGRPVKYAMTRQQTFRSVGYRPASVQRVRLGADADGRLTAIEHESWSPTSSLRPYADSVSAPTRVMYAAPAQRTVTNVLELDVAPPVFMRGPGEYQGMFALESAVDELAVSLGIDPIQLRIRNEPHLDPESGKPFSSRNLIACLLQGADRFGWSRRVEPGQRREGEWLIGMGVAAATFPGSHHMPSRAKVVHEQGIYTVSLQAADIGTGARTVLTQIAADGLGVPMDRIRLELGRTGLPMATIAGGSVGTYEWGNAITLAIRKFIRKHGFSPSDGASVTATSGQVKGARGFARHVFGAHFSQVRVSTATGEVRVDRSLGMFAAGQIINPLTARSQMVGGITMGISGALHEEAYLDTRFGSVANGDLAGYHIAAHADVHDIEIGWVGEPDPRFGAMGGKGIGEVGVVGVPAAIGNAIYNAAGVRLREIPFTPDRVITALGRAEAATASS